MDINNINLAQCAKVKPAPGRVQLFRMDQMAPDLWSLVKESTRYKQDSKKLAKLGVTDESLGSALDTLSTEKIRSLLFEGNYRKITLNPADRLEFTERESMFSMEYAFTTVWSGVVVKYGFPQESKYVDSFLKLNTESIEDNLSYRWTDPENEEGPLTCAAHMKYVLNQYEKYDLGEPHFTEEEIKPLIMKGIIYRAKKFFAAAMREFCAMYELTASDYKGLPDPPSVFYHPYFDNRLKADAIGLGNGKNARVIPIAIYLNTGRSVENIDRKSNGDVFTEMHEMPIAMRGPKDEIFLPREEDIEATRDALDAGRPKHRSYDAAKKGLLAA